MTIKEIRIILEKTNFPERFNTDQTAICIMALLDNSEKDMTLFTKKNIKEREELIKRLKGKSAILKRRTAYRRRGKEDVIVQLSDKEAFSLSPGKHNLLEKSIVEIFARAFLSEPQVVYLGDTAPRKGYQNRTLMRKLNLPIDTAASLPDVIVFSEVDTHILVIEAVTSSGPVNALRLKQLLKFTKGPWKLG